MNPATADVPQSSDLTKLVNKHDSVSVPESAQHMFKFVNDLVFGGKLPDIPVRFETKLKSTAGMFDGRNKEIRLSRTICREKRTMLSVLVHEMCHAAEKYIDGAEPCHGPNFRKWGSLCNAKLGDCIDPVSRCHFYEVFRKYSWVCCECKHPNRSHKLGCVICKKCRVTNTIKKKTM
jgi:hypothetical protein